MVTETTGIKAKATPRSPKFLQFPANRAIGKLYSWAPRSGRGREYCDATGKVACPAGVILVLRPHATELAKPDYFRQVPADIEGLDLGALDADNALVKRLTQRFRNIRVLLLESCDVDDSVFDTLVDLPLLQRLDLQATAIDGSGLSRLGKMPALEEINLRQSTLLQDNCKYFSLSSALADLVLEDCEIRDSACKYLAKIPKLETLNLNNTLVTDKGVSDLLPLKGLAVNDTGVSDKSAQYLIKLKQLTELGLQHTRYTKSGITTIKEALPNCNVRL